MGIEQQVDLAIKRAKIEELEQIKAEIEGIRDSWDRNANDYTFGHYNAYDNVTDIIDKYISELKGENNG